MLNFDPDGGLSPLHERAANLDRGRLFFVPGVPTQAIGTAHEGLERAILSVPLPGHNRLHLFVLPPSSAQGKAPNDFAPIKFRESGHPDACRNSLKKNIRPQPADLKSIRAAQRKKRRRHPEN